MSLDDKKGWNKLLIEKYRYNKMSASKDEAEIRLGDADNGVKAKSSPSLTSLFEKLAEILKKYWWNYGLAVWWKKEKNKKSSKTKKPDESMDDYQLSRAFDLILALDLANNKFKR